jgi:hypothetical protein
VQLSISSHSAAIPRQGADTKPEAGYGKPVNSVSMLILKDVIEACAYVVMAFLPKSGLEMTVSWKTKYAVLPSIRLLQDIRTGMNADSCGFI